MQNAYRINKEKDGFVVSTRKTGFVLVVFDRKDEAEAYRDAQVRADEQTQVLRAYNEAEELRCLLAEFLAEGI